MEKLTAIREAVLSGDAEVIQRLVGELLDAGVEPQTIIEDGLLKGLETIGESFKRHEAFLPEVLVATHAVNAGIRLIKGSGLESSGKAPATIVIGTVKNDLHDIGKNLVAMLLENGGFRVIDLGIDVSPAKFAESITLEKPQIVGMSALLSTTLPEMQVAINYLKEQGLRETVKIMVGGAPVTESYAKSIGADGYAPDAVSALELARQLI